MVLVYFRNKPTVTDSAHRDRGLWGHDQVRSGHTLVLAKVPVLLRKFSGWGWQSTDTGSGLSSDGRCGDPGASKCQHICVFTCVSMYL